MKKYYLAYGSNLNIQQMKYRCPDAKPIGTAFIKGYELLFKGSKTGSYLTIEKAEKSKVPVAVWEVSAADERRLDVYEGCPNFYYKTEMEVTVNRRKIKAFVYIMHEEKPIGIILKRRYTVYNARGKPKRKTNFRRKRKWQKHGK